MLGAIIGDTVGSVYEFHNTRTKNFKLFTDHSKPTDDSIMTLAVAEILLSGDTEYANVVDTMRRWGYNYQDAGYGGRFRNWLRVSDPRPYNSCGNGSAMRVSPVGWVAQSEEEVIRLSKAVTEITHNHPEGLKGAEVVAMCIFKARMGATKEQLREYIVSKYPIVKTLDYEDLRQHYRFSELCQESVPQALYCFLISTDFEDCLRTTISIGGDCDTTSAMSCAIAEAFYGIPENIKDQIFDYLDIDMVELINKFEKKYGGK